MNGNKISELIEFAKQFYNTLDDAHGVNHGSRVAKLAMLIQSQEGGDPFIVEAGAWLHQFHDNLDMLQNGLNNLNLPNDIKDNLFHIVEVCRPKKIQNAQTIEAKIVYDADGLECVGPHGNIRELLCNVRDRNIPLDKSIDNTIEVENLFISTLQTKTGKNVAKKLSELTNEFWLLYGVQEKLESSLLS
jgi:HD superfamily phosphodiesterase